MVFIEQRAGGGGWDYRFVARLQVGVLHMCTSCLEGIDRRTTRPCSSSQLTHHNSLRSSSLLCSRGCYRFYMYLTGLALLFCKPSASHLSREAIIVWVVFSQTSSFHGLTFIWVALTSRLSQRQNLRVSRQKTRFR